MEEILASIRKIIAEDASGSRAASPSPSSSLRSNGAKPASAPQRGFMSREAFMRSSTPQEESESQRYFTPVTPHDPQPGQEPEAKAGLSSSSSPKSEKVEPEATSAVVAVEVEKPSAPAEQKRHEEEIEAEATRVVTAEQKSASASGAVEAKKDSGSPPMSEVKAEPEANTIDAQLVQLLDEDIKALRESEKRPDADKPDAKDESHRKDVDALTKLPQEPIPSVPKPEPAPSSPIKVTGPTPEGRDNSDPFAFDLGPSPFLPRSSVEQPAEPSRTEASPYAARGGAKVNGTSVSAEPIQPKASQAKSHESAPSFLPPTQAPRSMPSFAVPSVSATLGPHRRLEPLSDSFRPTPSDRPASREAHPADPFQRPDYGYAGTSENTAEVHDQRHEAVLQPASPPSLETAASAVGSIDRTMEDAVADLLRPLLKTWLAENMPKIVERALRREMTERLLPNNKNSRD